MHYLLVDTLDADAGEMAIDGEQARHAVRVRRMADGEPLTLIDGQGRTAQAVVRGSDKNGPQRTWRLLVRVTAVHEHPRPCPEVHVICPAPKGDLVETMIDQLSQVGASSWRPLDSQWSEREPRAGKIDRLQRIAHESAKQCGRPWFLDIGEPIGFDEAIRLPGVVLADGEGVSPLRVYMDAPPDYWDRGIHILVGPEGGFSEDERNKARQAELEMVGLGPHVLRIGTAAVAAASGFVLAPRDAPP